MTFFVSHPLSALGHDVISRVVRLEGKYRPMANNECDMKNDIIWSLTYTFWSHWKFYWKKIVLAWIWKLEYMKLWYLCNGVLPVFAFLTNFCIHQSLVRSRLQCLFYRVYNSFGSISKMTDDSVTKLARYINRNRW